MTEENLGGEAGLIEERKKKLKLLRESNKAYVNDFDRTHRAEAIIAEYQEFSKAELDEKNIIFHPIHCIIAIVVIEHFFFMFLF